MSNKQKLKGPNPFEGIEAAEWHAVQALWVAGQKSVQCKYCHGPNPITLETILDGDSTVLGVVWRICADHGLEVICGDCAKKHRPEIIS